MHVSKLYRKAGYRVRRNIISRAGEIDFIATRGGQKIVGEVKSGRQTITSSVVEKIARKAKYHRGTPVIRHGPKVNITNKAKRTARKLGVKLKSY